MDGYLEIYSQVESTIKVTARDQTGKAIQEITVLTRNGVNKVPLEPCAYADIQIGRKAVYRAAVEPGVAQMPSNLPATIDSESVRLLLTINLTLRLMSKFWIRRCAKMNMLIRRVRFSSALRTRKRDCPNITRRSTFRRNCKTFRRYAAHCTTENIRALTQVRSKSHRQSRKRSLASIDLARFPIG